MIVEKIFQRYLLRIFFKKYSPKMHKEKSLRALWTAKFRYWINFKGNDEKQKS